MLWVSGTSSGFLVLVTQVILLGSSPFCCGLSVRGVMWMGGLGWQNQAWECHEALRDSCVPPSHLWNSVFQLLLILSIMFIMIVIQ